MEEKIDSTKLQIMWIEDAKIDLDDPEKADRDTLRGARLHSKYLAYMIRAGKEMARLNRKKMTMKFWLEGYYKSGLYHEELGRNKNNPKIAKTNEEATKMAEADSEWEKLSAEYDEAEAMAKTAKEAMDYIRWSRTKDITNSIEMKKWYNGQL